MGAIHFRILTAMLLLFGWQQAYASTDERMIIDLPMNNETGTTLENFQNDIKGAAALALPQLWQRIIPQAAIKTVPKHVQAVRFLQRVVPTVDGVIVYFSRDRLFSWLDYKHIPYLPQTTVFSLQVQVFDSNGLPLQAEADALYHYAVTTAPQWGYRLQQHAPKELTLRWQLISSQEALLQVGGDTTLGAFSDRRRFAPGSVSAQLTPWLHELLLRARDHSEATFSGDKPQANSIPSEMIMLTIAHQSSLPEQVLLESDLRHDSHVLKLIPKRLNSEQQQYQLLLRANSLQWLSTWFHQHGMMLTGNEQGWLAQ